MRGVPHRRVALGLALAAALMVPAAAQSPALPMLDALEPGQWTLRDRDGLSGTRSICLANGSNLLAVDRPATCRTSVIRSSASEVVVHDSCGAAGHRDIAIRRETARLVQIELQGIRAGAPFSTAYEARRVGSCR